MEATKAKFLNKSAQWQRFAAQSCKPQGHSFAAQSCKPQGQRFAAQSYKPQRKFCRTNLQTTGVKIFQQNGCMPCMDKDKVCGLQLCTAKLCPCGLQLCAAKRCPCGIFFVVLCSVFYLQH
jgi:hypothetical protein